MSVLVERNRMSDCVAARPAPVPAPRRSEPINFPPLPTKKVPSGPSFRARRRLTFEDPSTPSPAEVSVNSQPEDPLVLHSFQELREATEEAAKRWNFDFINHVPLPGRYEWEEAESVSPVRDIVISYENGYQVALAGNLPMARLDDPTNSTAAAATQEGPDTRKQSYRQLLITDMFKSSKRTTSASVTKRVTDVDEADEEKEKPKGKQARVE